jgi:outer membrane protein assembly factor BamB
VKAALVDWCRHVCGLGVALATAGATLGPVAASKPARGGASRLLWHISGEGRGVPVADDETGYFLSRHHEVVAVDLANGTTRWTGVTGETGPGTAGSRLVLSGTLVLAGDYDIVAFDRATGKRKWRFKPSAGYAPGLYLGESAGRRVFAGSPSGRLYALDSQSGRQLWNHPVVLDGNTTVFAPIVSGDLVVAGFVTFTGPARGGLVAVEAATGRERWRVRLPVPSVPSIGAGPAGGPLAWRDALLVSSRDGTIWAFDRASGERRWSLPSAQWKRGANPAAIEPDFRALVLSGNLLVAGSLTGLVVAFDHDAREERWRSAPSETSTAFALTADRHRVYVPYFSGELAALNAEDGGECWRFGHDRVSITSPPAVAAGVLLVSSADGGYLALSRETSCWR